MNMYVRPRGVSFSCGFGLKKGIDFHHFHSGFSLLQLSVYKGLCFPCRRWQMCSPYQMFIQMKPILANVVIYILEPNTKFRGLEWGVDFRADLKEGMKNHRFWSERRYRFTMSGRAPSPKAFGSNFPHHPPTTRVCLSTVIRNGRVHWKVSHNFII